jgi:hypothetical protein
MIEVSSSHPYDEVAEGISTFPTRNYLPLSANNPTGNHPALPEAHPRP